MFKHVDDGLLREHVPVLPSFIDDFGGFDTIQFPGKVDIHHDDIGFFVLQYFQGLLPGICDSDNIMITFLQRFFKQ
jgi:hypothetical protein